MKKKKNRFWLFLLSLCPGAGHMYLGFMKMGLSFMIGFILPCVLADLTGLGAFGAVAVIVYIYALFHANNLGGLDDERFYATEDQYLLGLDGIGSGEWRLDRKYRNIAAAVLILIGISMLWDMGFGILRSYLGTDNPMIRSIYYFMRDVVPRAVMATVIIWVGIRLIKGKKGGVEDGNAGEGE
ncbi:MAG: hypothetical protein NC302_01595 [Bacteroidales bacterium]|nr:hypothetical protein [Bacteroidales bacterium]MCM1414668.1 hypothetical protein [bacterium]MCM1424882.1 hypothetical protein [bacterium]